MKNPELEYAGFWVRVGASIIDSIVLLLVALPIMFAVYGDDYFSGEISSFEPVKFFMDWVFPAIAVILFWMYKSATPGKIALSLKVVDASSGRAITAGQSIGRYLGYFVSLVPFGLGILWVAFDRKKQGWHDKLASTVVVRDKTGNVDPVEFV